MTSTPYTGTAIPPFTGTASGTSRPSTTPEQNREILRKARALFADHVPETSRTSREPRRTDQSRFKLVHKTTYTPRDEDDQPAASTAVAVRATPPVATASATYQGPWWEWTDQRIEGAISAEHEFVMEIMGDALGECMRDLREPLEREIKLLRREFEVLREEIRVARGLRDLREEVAEARQEVPQLRALEQRVRAEASIVRADVTATQAEMRQELAAHKRTTSVLRARQSNTDFNLARFMRSMANVQTSEFAYESADERMVIRQQIHPDAAKALREFAATVLDNDDVVH
jgi:hypothetical protein